MAALVSAEGILLDLLSFIGLILLPIVGNAGKLIKIQVGTMSGTDNLLDQLNTSLLSGEQAIFTTVRSRFRLYAWASHRMAMRGKMEITIGVSVGSSIQIAAGMIPILVLAAWPLKKDLTLYFADFEVSGIAFHGGWDLQLIGR